ncbi:response regulator, partial [Candidatus Electronema sp. PJ]|uniref:response regulator n=1 Tax=Candidatus Electronema sp. PJ TaxID=3401572 RepID=UPI003AA88A2B
SQLKNKTALLTTILRLTVRYERVGEADHASFSCQSKPPALSRWSIHSKLAVRLRDVRRSFFEYEPNIVHFCGHSGEDGIILEREDGNSVVVNPDALSGLFELFSSHIECVFFNACYSESQAEAISSCIPYIVGLKKEISDRSAIEFAVGFYDAIGAGRPFDEAFNFGKNALDLCNSPRKEYPVLIKNLRVKIAYNTPSILIIDDQPESLKCLLNFLKDADINVRVTQDGKHGIEMAKNGDADIILLDILMPEMDGFEVCRRLKNIPSIRHIPVIFITALFSVEDKIEAFNAGGIDYITKPFQREEVLARIKIHFNAAILQKELYESNKSMSELIKEKNKLLETINNMIPSSGA